MTDAGCRRIGAWLAAALAAAGMILAPAAASAGPALAFQAHEGLNDNAFLQDGPVAAHLVLRSGDAPRILIAFPAGNSGVGLWFSPPAHPVRWTLTAKPRPVMERDAQGRPLRGIVADVAAETPTLKVRKALASSVRVLRDYQQAGRAPPELEPHLRIRERALSWSRDRLDGAPGYRLTVQVLHGALAGDRIVAAADGRIVLRVTGLTGETPLRPFAGRGPLNTSAARDPAARNVLRFLSYEEKFLAGSWRFDTYFGRDTLMSVRLLMPALRPEAVEAGLGSVLARLSAAGEVAHEEDIGEFAVLDHHKAGDGGADAPTYDYGMIDGTFMLAPVTAAWLLDDPRGRVRARAFLAGEAREGERGRRRGEALVANLRIVMAQAAPFADQPTAARLIALKPGHDAGNWRDSTTGLGGGRYPYDVNAVLVPAALDAAARLYASGELTPYLTPADRALFAHAADMAQVWRTRAGGFFVVERDAGAADRKLAAYAQTIGVRDDAARAALNGAGVRFFAVALDAGGQPEPVMNSDLGFDLLLGAPSSPVAVDAAVTALMRPFPAGLLTDVGLVVANPAFASPALQPSFGRGAYHGTVVWSWQQAVFAAGLARQLQRTDLPPAVRSDLEAAQRRLWQAIGAARGMRNSELWSWAFADGRYRVQPFGASGADADESNAAQLWSTVYLAVKPPAGPKISRRP